MSLVSHVSHASHASHFCEFFFLRLVQGLGDRRSFRGRLSLNYRYEPPLRHLESGDDPGDECKWYNLALRVLSLSLGIYYLNLSTKVPKIEIFPEEILISLRFGQNYCWCVKYEKCSKHLYIVPSQFISKLPTCRYSFIIPYKIGMTLTISPDMAIMETLKTDLSLV